MKVFKESINLVEDKFTDFEGGTYFKQLKDRNGNSYPIPTIYQILGISGDSVICNVVGHDYSDRFRVNLTYLQKALELGYFQILNETECKEVQAKELARRAKLSHR